VTAGGDDNVELLWPAAAVWPPEVDFNETGNGTSKTGWYVHYTSEDHQVAKTLRINLTKWHTWGVIWTPSRMTFTVDGKVWGIVTASSAIPHQAMTLDIQQQTFCGIAPECPTKPLSMLVNWVTEFER
jgi:beta-glucanase (GH16 family)